jgi:hypothetical protein
VPQLLFGALEVLNIGNRSVPSDDIAALVAQRLAPEKEPAISSIVASHACFDLTLLTRSQECPPLGHRLLQVFGMNGDFPSPAVSLLGGEARIFMPSLVEELDRAIRETAPCERRDGIDHHPKFVFGNLHFGTALLNSLSHGTARKYPAISFPGATGSTSGARSVFSMSHQVRFCGETL